MTPLAFLAKVFTALRGLLPLVVVLALLLSGCGMKAYEGPELPRSEIAVIDRWYWHGSILTFAGILPVWHPRHEARVYEIDGTQAPGYRFHVRPGEHSVTVGYKKNISVTLCGYTGCIGEYRTRLSINFTAEAGHEYRIPAERRDERNWIWVEDKTTGKVVAGEKPPDDQGEGKHPATPPE
jgi:hypothetical protein